ncbi:MAG: hypothetical protein R2820_07240 [Cyclobacteriaceae bacterium]
MKLFQPIEIEIKTGWTPAELIHRLSAIAKFNDNEFTIAPDLWATNLYSYVKGTVGTNDSWTVLSFTVYPSFVLKGFATLWLGGVGIVLIFMTISSLIYWEFNSQIGLVLGGWILGFILTQLSFRSSVDQRETAIRQIMKV